MTATLHEYHGHLRVERADTHQQATDSLHIFARSDAAADHAAEVGYRLQGLRILDGTLRHCPDCRACA